MNCHENKRYERRSLLTHKRATIHFLQECGMLCLPIIHRSLFKRPLVGFLAIWLFIFAFCSFNDVSSAARLFRVLGFKEREQRESFKLRLNEQIANDEADVARERKPSQRRLPWKELIIDKSGTDLRLQSTIEEELKKILVMPFVSWGVYHMYRSAFPPEINIPNFKADQPYDGKPPTAKKLESNQILIAHRVPNPRRMLYSIQNWENRMNIDKAKNVAIYLMGDEFNYGSSFVNDWLSGAASPFSFLVRDYFFDPLKNADHAKVIQLGTMTCQTHKLACSVKPSDTIFVNMLPSAVKIELRPSTFVKASERKRKCYWAGSDRNDRQQMVKYFEKSGGCEVYLTPGFNQGNNKTVYADILADSAFGLIPSGNSPETHRLAEVLMFGAIPVMLDRDAGAPHMHSYSEPIPVVSGRTWEQVDQRMRALSNDDLDQLQQRVLDWWDRHWSCVHNDLRWIMAQAHAISDGRDLCTSFDSTLDEK